MNTPLIAPSILSADFPRFGKEIEQVVMVGIDWIRIDVEIDATIGNIDIILRDRLSRVWNEAFMPAVIENMVGADSSIFINL